MSIPGRPRLLDLFCKAGGATKGYQLAGFEVTGVDIEPQPRYCGEHFIQADALELLADGGWKGFDAIHASPPCQFASVLRNLPWLKGKDYPALIKPVRDLLISIGPPWVIENAYSARYGSKQLSRFGLAEHGMKGGWLCGTMFGLPLYRHRVFETSFFFLQPAHPRHEVVIGHGRLVNDRAKGTLNSGSSKGAWGNQAIVTVAGGQYRKADGERAMQIDWMTKDELSEAVAPAYTRFIGEHLMRVVRASQAPSCGSMA